MTTAFTPVYPLPATTLLMGKSAAPDGLGLALNLAGGRGTRIPDLRLLLAVHSARQATGRTAQIVREGDLMLAVGDEPARLTLVFGPAGASPKARLRAAGSFNARVAAHISVGTDGEGGVYPGG